MRVLTAKEMRHIDEYAIKEWGIPSLVLMENAGTGVLRILESAFPGLLQRRVAILVGPGNNGGDGLVLARHLLNRNGRVKVYLFGQEGQLSPECQHNLDLYIKIGGELSFIDHQGLTKLKFALAMADLVVDALLGTGAQGPLRE